MAQHIIVTDYDPRWPAEYEKESEKIKAILGENCVAIYHIGSTAVPGLAAKPIIDIMPVVRSLEKTDQKSSEFEKEGYLRKGQDERTHQVHIFEEKNKADITRHLAVRDYLRTHREAAEQYGCLKTELAKVYPYDIEGYCDGKEEFVKKLEQEALLWKGEQ